MEYKDVLGKLLKSKKALFASAGGLGGAVSAIIYLIIFGEELSNSFWVWVSWSIAGALEASLIGVMIVYAQNFYKTHNVKNFNGLKAALKIGFQGGLVGGFAGCVYTNTISDSADVGRVIGWAIIGGISGFVVSKQIPNFKKLHAVGAGAIGGFIGCLILYMGLGFVTGVAFSGALIGLMVALAEVIFRKSWIDVNIYSEPLGKGLNMGKLLLRYTLTLGEKPIKVGFGEDMDINLKPGNLTAASHLGSIYSEGENVFFQEIATNQKIVLNSAEKFRYRECEILLEAAPIR